VIRLVIAAALFIGAQAMAQTEQTPAPAAGAAKTSSSPATEATDDGAAGTSEYKVHMDVKESRLMFGLYGQMSSFARQGTSLIGYNLEGIANYAMTDKTAIQISLAQSLDMADGFSVLFTGLRLGAGYAWWGQFTRRSSKLRVNGQETFSVQTQEESMLIFDAGIDQYLFNGTDRIVPATGVSLGARFDRNIWGQRGSIMFRYGQLVIAQDPVALMTAGLGVLLRF
jgi:hypothetical protein